MANELRSPPNLPYGGFVSACGIAEQLFLDNWLGARLFPGRAVLNVPCLPMKPQVVSRRLCAALLVALFLSACEPPGDETAPTRPNIIFIMADDHANRAISAYNGSINATPNIDRLADEGALFLNSFCANSICGPSRASILTGTHSHVNGVTGNGAAWDSLQMVFPRALKEAGYQSVLFGKWHLNSKPGDEFDTYKILTGAGRQGFYYNPEFFDSETGTETMQGYSTDLVTDEALRWLEEARDPDQPFSLLVQYKAPHVPRMPPIRHLERYLNDTIPEPETFFDDFATRSHYATDVNFHIEDFRPIPAYGTYDPDEYNIYFARMTDAQRRAYHAVVDPQNAAFRERKASMDSTARKKYAYQRFIKDYLRLVDTVDENVGRILDWLDAHEALKENTIVIYTGDQSYFTGEHGYAEKRLMYDPAMQMPLLMRWPAGIEPGTRVEPLVQNIDYAPTFLDLAGVPVPTEMQGRSVRPLLDGGAEGWREAVYYHYYDHGQHNVGRHEGVRTGRYKLIRFYTDDVWEFYDLQNDPNEVNNLYGQPEAAGEIDRMKRALAGLRQQYGVPGWVFEPPYVSLRGIRATDHPGAAGSEQR